MAVLQHVLQKISSPHASAPKSFYPLTTVISRALLITALQSRVSSKPRAGEHPQPCTRDREGCAAGRPGAPRLRARRARHLGTAAAAVAALLFLVLFVSLLFFVFVLLLLFFFMLLLRLSSRLSRCCCWLLTCSSRPPCSSRSCPVSRAWLRLPTPAATGALLLAPCRAAMTLPRPTRPCLSRLSRVCVSLSLVGASTRWPPPRSDGW